MGVAVYVSTASVVAFVTAVDAVVIVVAFATVVA